MARKLIGLSLASPGTLPSGCAGCVYWESEERLPRHCGAVCDPDASAAWIRQVVAEWGECGRAATDDGSVLGFVKYAPPQYFAQTRYMPSGPPLDDVPLIACLHVDPEARGRGLGGVLLRSALRDLAQRGERSVQLYADATRAPIEGNPLVGVAFGLRHGFIVERPHPDVPLLRLDLKSLVSWADNLEAVLDSLRLPIRVPQRTPVTLCPPKGER